MKLKFDQLIRKLKDAPPERGQLYDLSNLTHEEAKEFQPRWNTLPPETRERVMGMLVAIAEKDLEVSFSAVFRMALDDGNPIVRQHAIEGLWEENDVRLISRLIALATADDTPEVRAAAATSLGRFVLLGELGKIRPGPHRKVFEALLKVCKSDNELLEVQRRALESIAYSEEEEVQALIQRSYQHADERVRVSAIFAMGRSADERWASCVAEELHNANPAMRYEAARACGELEAENAVSALVEMVEDVDSEVQEAAIWALGQIGGDEARSALEMCARSDNEAKRAAAADALREMEFLHGNVGALLFPFALDEEEDEEDDL
jgi:HEAT repeat protein